MADKCAAKGCDKTMGEKDAAYAYQVFDHHLRQQFKMGGEYVLYFCTEEHREAWKKANAEALAASQR